MIIFKQMSLLNILYFNILILPTLLITGPFLSDLAISVNAIIFLYLSIKKKNFEFFQIRIVKIILLVWLFFIISSLFSDHKLYSLKSSFFYFRFFLFIGSMYLVKNKLLVINKFKFFAFILPILVVSIDVIFQSFLGFNFVGKTSWDPSRNSSFFGDEHVSGSYIIRMLPLSILYLYWVIEKKNNNNLYYYLFLFLIIANLGTFLSGERTAFLLTLLLNVYILFSFSKFKKIGFYIFLISSLFISVLVYTNETVRNRMIHDTYKDIGVSELLDRDKFIENFNANKLSPHYYHFKAAILMYKDNKIFGVGPKNFRKLCYEKKYTINSFSCATHPHSTWIQILTETGIIPFIILIITFFILVLNTSKFIFYNIKGKKNMINDEKVLLTGAFLITLWPLIPSGSFFNNWLSIIYFFPLGFYLIINQK